MSLLKFIPLVLLLLFFFSSCKSKESKAESKTASQATERKIIFSPGPQAIVYKTKENYDNLVPVNMNGDRSQILSYPAPSDISYNGKLSKPTKLKNGYLLDNRGIGPYTAFLDYTYDEYKNLPQAPTNKELMSRIKEKYPFKEFVYCGLRTQYKNEVKELNEVIDSNFKNCRIFDVQNP